MATRYSVKVDVSAVSDTGTPGDDWDRWGQGMDVDGNTVPEDPRVEPMGMSDETDYWDHWIITAESEDEAREVVQRYADAVGCDVTVAEIEAI